ncbi:MAG: chloride channel protein, partial [Gammaproteobacteria bacterium]
MSVSMNLLPGIARVLLFGGLIGALAALAALAFVEGVQWLNDVSWVTFSRRQSLPSSLFLLLIIPPALGGLLAGGLIRQLPDKRAHNPADVIEAAQSARHIPFRSGLLTALAALAGLGGGASVGIYGPLTHLGATIGSALA